MTLDALDRRRSPAALLAFFAISTAAFEAVEYGPIEARATVNTRLGLQYGTGTNFGLGAIDNLGDTERAALSASVKPKLDLSWKRPHAEFYGAVSVVAAAATLDGEISGQWARGGDEAWDTDDAFLGWRNEVVDFSVGGQEFWVGDGLIIGDGNFDTGGEDGQYWVVPFAAWRNSSILKVNAGPVRGDVFWLRSDQDFGDARLSGINLETTATDAGGRFGFMYLEIFEGAALNLDGMNVWDLRAAGVRIPGIAHLEIYAEFVRQAGTDVDGGGRDNDATGWYLEGQYSLAALPWTPRIAYRYARFSGDDPDTADNEEYRTLFYSFFRRDWDTWYQGEIAGEYQLYNQNQITQMVKLKAYPRPAWILTLYYYRHDLEEPHYFGIPVASREWADEVNAGVEYYPGEHFYAYAGVAWSTPDDAVRELFGNDDFTVIQTFISYTF